MATAGEHFAGAAMRASSKLNAERDEMVETMRSMVREEVHAGMKDALVDVMTEEAARKFGGVLMDVAVERIEANAGKFLVNGIKGGMKTLFWWGLGIGVLLYIGGWPLMKAAWTAVTKGQ